jgi:hypothetical protein
MDEAQEARRGLFPGNPGPVEKRDDRREVAQAMRLVIFPTPSPPPGYYGKPEARSRGNVSQRCGRRRRFLPVRLRRFSLPTLRG